MTRIESTTETVAGVTLVELRIESDARRRVTLEPTHDGPIWPPRRQGVPERGWSEDGWTGTVSPDEPRSLGYATPVDPPNPPMELTDATPADAAAPAEPGPREVLRALGDPRPPRDAVRRGTESSSAADASESGPGTPSVTTATATDALAAATGDDLEDIAARLDRAEDLATVSSVEEAGEVVEAAGGIESARRLVEQLERDRARLDRLHERTAHLRERATVEVPLDDLARLV